MGNVNENKYENKDVDVTNNENDDLRAVIYQNITGNTMTYEPLVNLRKLGYTVQELERIQAEILSVIVLDKRKNPKRGGVPTQWKIKNSRAPSEITIVNSIEEASKIVHRMNDEEQKERNSIIERRRPQERRESSNRRKRSSGGVSTKSQETTDDNDKFDDRRRGRGRRRNSRATKNNKAADRERKGQSSETRKRERRNIGVRYNDNDNDDDDDIDDNERRVESRDGRRTRRDRRQQRSSNNENDDSPVRRNIEGRRIYSVPRGDRRGVPRDDPPDPNSPIWVDMDSFRDLLRKEADFRMQFLGDDWAPTIKQENNWRTELYKNWLFALNTGVGGDGIVPPSRYERARRNSSTNSRNIMPRKKGKQQEQPQRQRRRQRQRQISRPESRQQRRSPSLQPPRGQREEQQRSRSRYEQPQPRGQNLLVDENGGDDDDEDIRRPPFQRRSNSTR